MEKKKVNEGKPEKMKGMEKQQAVKSEHVQNELDHGSEKGQ
jgi:hypothetical protein